nr:ribonucleoside-diphosphate reductase large subunit-like [Ipomoea batatas]
MDNGLYFAQMRHRDWQIAGVNNLRNFIQNMKERLLSIQAQRKLLASIALPRFAREKVTAIVTTNLNKIVGVNFYPVETSKNSNLHHRPNGIGVQGLADTFIFCSPEAQDLNKEIFETICYHALEASSDLAAKESPL